MNLGEGAFKDALEYENATKFGYPVSRRLPLVNDGKLKFWRSANLFTDSDCTRSLTNNIATKDTKQN